jgi:hypothetical protein
MAVEQRYVIPKVSYGDEVPTGTFHSDEVPAGSFH